jgi:hypothetical protein
VAGHDCDDDTLASFDARWNFQRQKSLGAIESVVGQRRVRHPYIIEQPAIKPAGQAVQYAFPLALELGSPGEIGLRLAAKLESDKRRWLREQVAWRDLHCVLGIRCRSSNPVELNRRASILPSGDKLAAICRFDRGEHQVELRGNDQSTGFQETCAGVCEKHKNTVVEAEVADVVADNYVHALWKR